MKRSKMLLTFWLRLVSCGLILAGVLAVIYFGSRKIKAMKKGLSPIALIGIAACLGILVFGI